MRIAVSGSHSTGKSTLIAAFLERHADYAREPEAFEALADEIELTPSEGPTAESLLALLDDSIAAVLRHEAGASVLFERSPVDYLAYAAASRRSWPAGSITAFLETTVPSVREALGNLDAIVFLPVTAGGVPSRAGENRRFRGKVDAALRRALIDDEYDLFGEGTSPRVVEFSSLPGRHLDELIQLAKDPGASRGLRR